VNSDDFDPYAFLFTQADAVALTQADNETIDNWVRYKHLLPQRIGKRRLFNFFDLLTIDLIHMLQRLFKAEIHVSVHIAHQAAKEYMDDVEADRACILRGTPWPALTSMRGDAHVSLTRAEDGTLRASEHGDLNADGVTVVLPVKLIGRRLLAAVKDWSEQTA
jgi:hypothetical protein